MDILTAEWISTMFLWPAANYVKEYRETGKQGTLRLMIPKDSPVGLIDSYDVGVVAAHLLAQDSTSVHNQARYFLNGPEDVTGEQIVWLVEQYIGTKVEDVRFSDMSLIDAMIANTTESKNVTSTIKLALRIMEEGKCKASTTSPEILKLAPPKHTATEVLKRLLDESIKRHCTCQCNRCSRLIPLSFECLHWNI